MFLPYFEIKSHQDKIRNQSNSSSIYESLNIWNILTQSFIPSANHCSISFLCHALYIIGATKTTQNFCPHGIHTASYCSVLTFPSFNFCLFCTYFISFYIHISMNYLHLVKSRVWRRDK